MRVLRKGSCGLPFDQRGDIGVGCVGIGETLQTAARLGSATIAALPGDSFTASLAANHNGIPATAVLGRLVKDLANDKEAEAIARQVNLTAAAVMDHALASKRFADEIVGQGLTGRVADTTMRLTGINTWTEGLKRAWAMEFNGFIARQAEHAFDDLDPAFQKFLNRYGFNAADWDKLRATPQLDADGAKFCDVNGVEDQQLADRLQSAILDERRFAVIEPDARIRGAMSGGQQRGTFMGEIARSATQFKSFPMTFMMTHMMRSAIQDGAWGKVSAGTKLVALMTMAGAVTAQMQSVIAGRDPQDMSDPKFWTQAFVRKTALDAKLSLAGGTMSGSIDLNNTVAVRGKQAGGTVRDLVSISATDVATLGHPSIVTNVRGSGARPQYNASEILALSSDLAGLLTFHSSVSVARARPSRLGGSCGMYRQNVGA